MQGLQFLVSDIKVNKCQFFDVGLKNACNHIKWI